MQDTAPQPGLHYKVCDGLYTALTRAEDGTAAAVPNHGECLIPQLLLFPCALLRTNHVHASISALIADGLPIYVHNATFPRWDGPSS